MITDGDDARRASEFSHLKEKIDEYFLDVDTNCPYGLGRTAVFHQAYFAPLDEHVMELFLASGYRRNGNCLYTMKCPNCSACLSIRLLPEKFIPSRSQRRNLKKNTDLFVEIKDYELNEESIALCDKFLKSRYPSDNSGRRYSQDFFANTITPTQEVQYRLDGKLVGSCIVDQGINWLNAVYFYFDPSELKRGLGVYNILNLVQICLATGREYLYLGYQIDEVAAMNYKKKFRPYQILEAPLWEDYS